MQDPSLTAIGEAMAACRGSSYAQARAMPGAFYTSPQQLALEREHLFRREWIGVGRVEEVAEPGDYVTFDILDEPVLVIRGEDDRIRALSNVCRHRGMLIAQGRGHAHRLACPYHRWTYDTTGRLLSAPYIPKDAGFDLSSCRLPAFACETWQGFIFVALDPDAPPLAPRLAGLADMIGNYHFGEMRLGYLSEEVWETNWKCLMENFMEGYHLSPLHRTTLHPVNPTRLCRHFPPGEAYFGYLAGFSPDLPRSQRGHPDLSEAEADTCVMFAVPPGLAVGGAADYSSFIAIQPEGVESVRVKSGLFFHGDDWPQAAVDHAVELFQRTMAEDKEVLVRLKRGLRSRHYTPGRLAPADLEGPIRDFHRYLAKRLEPVLAGRSGG